MIRGIKFIFKGHNNVDKETCHSLSGEKFVMNRQKRVVKVHMVDILQLAQREIGFKYSLRTLLDLRPNGFYWQKMLML